MSFKKVVEEREIIQNVEVKYMTCDICGKIEDVTERCSNSFNPLPSGWMSFGNGSTREDYCNHCSDDLQRVINARKEGHRDT